MSVEQFLQIQQIEFVLHEHPPVYTCEELEKYKIPGLACKNLLLRDQKKRRFFLFILPADKRADLKEIGKRVIGTKVSFANPEIMKEKLGLEPGAVSPFGLLNDQNKEVEVFIDKTVYDAEQVHFHPNRNNASLELTGDMFRKYLQKIDHEIHIIPSDI